MIFTVWKFNYVNIIFFFIYLFIWILKLTKIDFIGLILLKNSNDLHVEKIEVRMIDLIFSGIRKRYIFNEYNIGFFV